MPRPKIAAGNWKMNKTLNDGLKLVREIRADTKASDGVQIILAPPAVFLPSIVSITADASHIEVAAQNCHEAEKGAYTGEIAVDMLASVGVKYVILGHSERRQYYGETNHLLAQKIDRVLGTDVLPIFCCGEALEIREAGQHVAFVGEQLRESLFHLSAEQMAKVIIAYEPIWAIGTGVTASKEQAQEMHREIRQLIAAQYSPELADAIPILYGGSVKPANAEALFAQADVDGGLVGGASLKAPDFCAIIHSFGE